MFDSIFGHQKTKQALHPFITGRVSGPYLMFGPPSVGKRSLAIEMARELLCIGVGGPECTCLSCKRFGSEHPDLFVTGTKEKIKTADIDSFLEFIRTVPFVSKSKIAVFDNAESMAWDTSNRLLKAFEDFSEGNFFFLITSMPDKVSPTLKSRCCPVEFWSLTQEDIINILWKKLGFELPKAKTLGWLSHHGNLDVFSKPGVYLDMRDKAVNFLSVLEGKDLSAWLDYVDRISEEDLLVFSDLLMVILTDLLYLKNSEETPWGEGIVNRDLVEQLQKHSKKYDLKVLLFLSNMMCSLKEFLYLNINVKNHLKNILIKTYPAFL